MSKRFAWPLHIFLFTFLICAFLWPLYEIIIGGFRNSNGQITLGYFREVFANPIYIEGLRNAFGLGIFTTIASLLIALPLAYFSCRYDFPFRKFFMTIVLLPLVLPSFVGAIGVQKILGTYGWLNEILFHLGLSNPLHPIDWLGKGQFWAIVIISSLSLYPILYLNLLAALSNIDPAMDEAAANLGCPSYKRFFKITLPLIRPGLFAGCTLVFVWAFTELGTPLIFDYNRLTSVQIFNGLKEVGNNPFPYALVSVLLLFSVFFYSLGKGFFGRANFSMLAKATHHSELQALSPIKRFFCLLLFITITSLALLPHFTVLCYSFSSDWYQSIFPNQWTFNNYLLSLGNQLTLVSIKNSIIYSGCATLLTLMTGIAIAFITTRTRLPGRHLLDALAMLPLAVPGLVMAFGYFAISMEGRPFAFLNPLKNPTTLLILAYSIRKMPFMIRSAVAGLQQVSSTYEEAAQNLGCPPTRSFLKITIPLITANLLAGALLVFSQTMLEVSDSLILAQKQSYYPITKAIYELMSILGDGPFLACALGVWAMTFLTAAIMGLSHLLGKNLGSIFRI